jgi:ankyrin repeat protein
MDTNTFQQFYKYVRQDNLYACEYIIDAMTHNNLLNTVFPHYDIDIDYDDFDTFSKQYPLYFAIKCEATQIIKYMLKKGANINQLPTHYNEYKESNLSAAISKLSKYSDYDLRLFYEEDIDDYVNNNNKKDKKRLEKNKERIKMEQAKNKIYNIVKILVDANANVNCPDQDINTPICLAALHSNIRIAKLLIESGANVNPIIIQEEYYHNNEGIYTVKYHKYTLYEMIIRHYYITSDDNPIDYESVLELLLHNGTELCPIDYDKYRNQCFYPEMIDLAMQIENKIRNKFILCVKKCIVKLNLFPNELYDLICYYL